MNLIRKLFTKITRPDFYTTCMIVLVFIAMGLYSLFCFLAEAPAAGLICLFIAIFFLGYGTYAIIVIIMRNWPRLEKWSEGRKYANKFVMNYDFRTICTTILSMIINLGFAVFNAVYGFMYMEWWCISLFIYYLMLIIMRSSISTRALTVTRHFDDTSRENAQLRVYQMAAIMLLVFTVALTFLLWELLSQDDFGFRHHILISVVTGVYAVIKVVLAVSNLIYTRGRHDKVTHAIRNINMADAMVSVLTLLMTFLTRFSDSATAVTVVRVIGTVICVYVVAMAVFMLVNSVVKLKKNRRTLYEMLMDSLNEDFESSLEEPAWEALYATAQYENIGYTVDSSLALEEKEESITDGGKDSLEDTADIQDSMLIPPDDLNPGFYNELYSMAGMDKPIPSAPVPEGDGAEDEYADEPTPLPAALVHHEEEDDGLEDYMHEYAVSEPVSVDAPAEAAPEAEPESMMTADNLPADEPVPESAATVPAADLTDETVPEPATAVPADDKPAAETAEEPSEGTYKDSSPVSAPEGSAEEVSAETASKAPAEPVLKTPAEDMPQAESPVDDMPSCEVPVEEVPADAAPAEGEAPEVRAEGADAESHEAAEQDETPAAEPVPVEDADAEAAVEEQAEPPAEHPAEGSVPAEAAAAEGPVEEQPERPKAVVYEVFHFYTPFANKRAAEPEAEAAAEEQTAAKPDSADALEKGGQGDLWIETDTDILDEDEMDLPDDEDAPDDRTPDGTETPEDTDTSPETE
ncbi:MAG: hypothetical protein LUD51_07505 [Clostridia bacterium]|nr:hypothetical protein [Clostridia bacterium]